MRFDAPAPEPIRQSLFVYGFLNNQFGWGSDFLTLAGQIMFQSSERGWNPLPFVSSDRLACSRTGTIIVGRSSDRKLELYQYDGTPITAVEHGWEEIRVLREEKTTWLKTQGSRVAASFLDKVELPDKRPPFISVQIDDTDLIWVERSRSRPRDTTPTFDVFNLAGEWVGTQSIEFRPTRISGGHMYVIVPPGEEGLRLKRFSLVPLHW